jgi:hypothetical protein
MSQKIELSIVDGKLVANPEVLGIKQGEKIKWEFVPEISGYEFFLSGKSNDGSDVLVDKVKPEKKPKIKNKVKLRAKVGTEWEYNIHLFKDEKEIYVLDPKLVIEPTPFIVIDKKLIGVVSVILLACLPFVIKSLKRRSK